MKRLALILGILGIAMLSLAATGTVTITAINPGLRTGTVPISQVTRWVDVCTAPETAESDSGVVVSGVVVQPGSITRSAQNWLIVGGQGTTVQFRLKYPTAGSVSTQPVVQCFGRDSGGTNVWRLKDKDATHALTLTVDTTNDVQDGASTEFSYTDPVEVDADGAYDVICAVKTALAGTSLTNATIQARIK